ncbi:3-carboxy-cis,cis-muconate cycloisomerase [Roseivivax sp. THAF40]|uniref:lyase family protein n=1 Tax=unclassified Roseivivax TaxID=2639302 RepID=UPI0012692C01|nr:MULTISPECIES: lyase family protein [unclassified Roseivivax]QFS83793.1 3-carboxy-cis,cis-muconate cycloisomerase [Roseivivax sp. THAF197b]QFT47625.1 3-carboxy-cis,cis-muconate cycloisomerase [Roseivivax sp. THAF40]
MSASLFDSALYGKLVPTGEVARLFSDTAEVRAMLIVEGALAQVQGAAGLIPEISAKAIHRASLELQIDPGGLAEATGENGVPVPALVAAFRELMQAPEHAQYIHFGATSQDIMDTALMLRLRQVLSHYETGLTRVLRALAAQAETHADLPMAARTYGQHATPTTFGAVAASWGWPLLALRGELADLRDGLTVSLSGAAGTASVLGPDPAAVRAALAKALNLADPGHSWHTDRGAITRLGAWIARLTVALGKMGEDLIALTASECRELRLGGTGASSTMPQKQNPVAPSVLVMLQHHAASLSSSLQNAAVHRHQRDGAAWFTEWMTLPQLCLTGAAALERAGPLTEDLAPDPAAMRATLAASKGALAAEALSFALARTMPRPEAQAAMKALTRDTAESGADLVATAARAYPDLEPADFTPERLTGTAPDEARAFARAVRDAG